MAKKNETKTFSDILSDLKAGIIADLYVLEGEEEYLKGKLLKALETLLIEPAVRTLDIVVFEPGGKTGSDDLNRIINELSTPPFMSRKRLIVIRKSGLFSSSRKAPSRNTDSSDEEESEAGAGEGEGADAADHPAIKGDGRNPTVSDLIDRACDTACLVFLEDKVDKRQKALIEKIQSKGILATISKPDPGTLRTWVRKEFERERIGISPDVIDAFIDRNDGGLLQMSNEITKLALYARSASKGRIGFDDLEAIGIADLKGSIFELVDALSAKKAGEAYRILDVLISQKQPVQLIFFMLARHIRQLITAKDIGSVPQIQHRMKVMPFVANKLYYQSRNVTFDNLEYIYKSCHDADVSVKTSRITDRIALDVLIAESADRIRS
ncbi:MAG: DNA polymerase III subunit delta [Saccharofermentanales bacterium]